MNTETNTKPLYKVLNEQRTQGQCAAIENKKSITNPFDLYVGDKAIGQIIWGINIKLPETIEEVKANAKYTALAVNSLAHLAETLECIKTNIELIGVNARAEIDILNLQMCKDALKRIY